MEIPASCLLPIRNVPGQCPASENVSGRKTDVLDRMTRVDLTHIDGVDGVTLKKVLRETVTGMSRWPTERHFASWLCLCLNNQVTGGKVKHTGVEPTQNRASIALRMAAYSLKRSNSALGRIIYTMLKKCSRYDDDGGESYEQHYRTRVIRNLNRQAVRFGFRLELSSPTPHRDGF